MNVLIVDDQPSSRMVLRCVLERLDMGLYLHEFGDPEQALNHAETMQLDCVLLDYRMPGMDGLEFARHFRLQPNHRDVPIMLVTAQDDAPLREEALRLGIIDVVVKPIIPRVMYTRCQNVLSLRRETVEARTKTLSLEDKLAWALKNLDERERELVLRGM